MKNEEFDHFNDLHLLNVLNLTRILRESGVVMK